MAKFCGGLKFDDSLKIIKGVLCLADAQDVDVSKAVTGCGQLWDGEAFKIVKVDGYRPCVTLERNGNTVDKMIAGNCGVGLDATFFTRVGKSISLADGYTLRVEFTPVDATVTVLGEDGNAVDPRETGEGYNVYTLKNLGGKYSITVEEDGYTGKSQTIDNDENQVVKVDLEEIVDEPIWKFDNFTTEAIPKSADEETGYYGQHFDISQDVPFLSDILTIGNTYKIIFDGQTYNNVLCVNHNSSYKFLGDIDGSAVAYYTINSSLGEIVITNASFENYPFFVTSIEYGNYVPSGCGQIYTQTSGTHSIAIYEA